MLKLKLMVVSVAGWLLLSGGAAPAQETNASAPAIDVYDGFETTSLSKVWDTSRFVPGAVEMQTNIFRAGHGAAKITLHARDTFEAGINGSRDSERDELMEAKKLTSKENTAYEYSFSMFIPTNFPIVPTRLVIAQWKQNCGGNDNCSDDSPVVAIRYVSGVLKITHQIGRHQTTLFETKDEARGQWLDFKIQTRFSTNETGRVKAWLNGKQVVDYTGVNAYPENEQTGYTHPSRFYFKMGLYRDLMAEPMTIYIDEYRKKELPEGSF
ncbi:MAG: polysaccharide lyase [Verrucomicrobiota bacterium]